MDVKAFAVTQADAVIALQEYKTHRSVYDRRDWEIERIYRRIAKGDVVIDAYDAIRQAGTDAAGRPRLAIMAADQLRVNCCVWSDQEVVFYNEFRSRASEWWFQIPWTGRPVRPIHDLVALVPRIPPQHRPNEKNLRQYQLLWEASWTEIPRDPYLLKRIGKAAWVVLAEWDLTEIELAVMRAHLGRR